MIGSATSGRFETLRRKMVQQQLGGIVDGRVRDAMAMIPRERFVGSVMQPRAYEDGPLPIGAGQTISQPWIVARMTELLGLDGHEKVLEIGTGSGYQTAILAALTRKVISLERIGDLARSARRRLSDLGLSNVTVLASDGTMGRSDYAPYDAVIVTAGAPAIPERLIEQVVVGGPVVIPVGDAKSQVLLRLTRTPDDDSGHVQWREERFENCRFVPLIGRFGWKEQ
ncbi:MAG: protein-L-isoaspartate(D-aspartate) O-methyltransferase [Deltaproteobacteria bacterium]|nr:protein-L-isoaspartate(D-aspartate) O-methyltransferase [Deltaproteobacteria bacterium]